ncbi:FecR domain-containing protein [Caulobacter segnis]|uniref:Iron dicitrate transport regulator FecR n=1 Tax=Caulobacter segnis TaxID=88688 RepID=A0A2W5WMY1_9CAUL|nr:FecR domain-containing protein [Caulobacter segnis]PZR35358.1 MAG: iron dicitrate transport regulator FecR [Caulobacter segnis]
MSRSAQHLQEAADWLIRLQRPEVDETDWLAFDAWLSDPGAQAAYDAVQAVDEEIFQRGAAVRGELAEPRRVAAKRTLLIDWRWLGGLGAAAAAAAVAIAIAPWGDLLPQPDTLYTTDKGESRTLELADGSRVDMNTDSHLSVRLDKDARRVTVHEGQALFDVAHDRARPFLITAGDETVRVVGTKFDVRRRDGQLSVTVLRGLVEVSTDGEDNPIRLHPGQMLEHVEGASGVSIRSVAAEDQIGWRSGRLVYRDQPLGRIVSDLNHYFVRPIRLDGENTATLRFSGVLIVDGQEAMVRRLTSLMPLSATPTNDAIVLRGRPSASN